MLIETNNAYQGNQAMAWVLLLYYHLLLEGGITNDQTVYVDSESFNAFEYVAVTVAPDQESEIDQQLLRRGAVVYLLCELNDMVGEYEDNYLEHPFTQRILSALASETAAMAVPEVSEIVQMVSAAQAPLDYAVLKGKLHDVFARYVVQEFKALAS